MSEDLLARARAALEGVTPGEWSVVSGAWGNVWHFPDEDENDQRPRLIVRMGGMKEADAQFIASARELVPELIGEVERIQGAIREADRQLARVENPDIKVSVARAILSGEEICSESDRIADRLAALEQTVARVRKLLPGIEAAIAAGIRGYISCETTALSYHEPQTDRGHLERVGRDADSIAAYVTTSRTWRDILAALDGTEAL